MKSVLVSTAAWPNLHYLFYLLNSTHVVIEQHETFPRQTYRNRYEILSANGVLPLTIPVKRTGNHTKSKDVLIDYSSDWQTQHWRALTSAYRKSPFFEFFEDELRPFYTQRTAGLIDFNLAQLGMITGLFGLKAEITLSTIFEKTPSRTVDNRWITDPRNHFDKDADAATVLRKKYYQTFGEKFPFTPNLSWLDLLFNVGLRGKEYF